MRTYNSKTKNNSDSYNRFFNLNEDSMTNPQIFDEVFQMVDIEPNLEMSAPLLFRSLRVFRRNYEIIHYFFLYSY